MWVEQDWEREHMLDYMYAIERQSLLEQEYFDYEQKLIKKSKKDEDNNNITPLRRTIKKRVKCRRSRNAKTSNRRKRKRN